MALRHMTARVATRQSKDLLVAQLCGKQDGILAATSIVARRFASDHQRPNEPYYGSTSTSSNFTPPQETQITQIEQPQPQPQQNTYTDNLNVESYNQTDAQASKGGKKGGGMMDSVKGFFGRGGGGDAEAVVDAVKEKVTEGIHRAEEAVGLGKHRAQEAGQKAANRAGSAARDAAKKGAKKAEHVYDDLKSEGKKKQRQVSGEVKRSASQGKKKVDEWANKAKDAVENYADEAESDLKKGIEKSREKTKSGIDKSKKKF